MELGAWLESVSILDKGDKRLSAFWGVSIILCKFFLTRLKEIRLHYKFEILGANAVFELQQELV